MQQPVAVITGAGRGIGRATAVLLAQHHYRVALLSRTRAELEQTRDLCGGGLVLPIDVTDPDAVEAAIREVLTQFGRIDAAIHCAGIAPVRSISEMTVQEWHTVVDTNLSAAFYLCKAVWPTFTQQKSGVVVNVSSVSARDPFAGFAAYGAAKAGLNLFGYSAAREGQKIGVRVHTIAPGAVETAMFRQNVTPEQFPTDRTLSPEEVGRVILQCVLGEMRYTSGEVIYLHKEL